ncbi:glycosyltransferase family 2 protein [Lacticaseibacillus saniviri]|uniref:Glycosyltransferase related enzyme n=1 Tax=Lacticaseibacillus saniviri JCM 17471 = DSM 24301 TaxID=1293598 RepID=A0A0R2MXG9_9LACO|nr:glycosyltransferase family 2 protein [Lacticaseibacillus saniviri]KRO15482.1 Glycosyltransferase related enzyme [Lacticaseibacillus saniviri JCM 17471 = DSM 24301]
MTTDPLVSIVLPVFNESEGIDNTLAVLSNYVRIRPERYELIFVDDGSQDDTVAKIQAAMAKNSAIRLVRFSRNFGHQLAITAGIRYTTGDAVVVMDADLQDPPSVIPAMLDQWQKGFSVVYGKRRHRSGETWFKKVTATTFYRLLAAMTKVDIPVDTGDFRLMDRQVVDILMTMNETDPYVRGMVSWVGFKQTAVLYDRQERTAGESKYPLRKMLNLAMNGLMSFSTAPLALASWLSGIALGISVLIVAISALLGDLALDTWILSSLFFLGSGGFLILGIIGTYIGRLFNQSRQRPLYIVEATYGFAQAKATPQYVQQRARM